MQASPREELDLVIGSIELPSAGTSSIINSLVEVYRRTTQDVHYIGKNNRINFPEDLYHEAQPVSTDSVSFSILDLPSVRIMRIKIIIRILISLNY